MAMSIKNNEIHHNLINFSNDDIIKITFIANKRKDVFFCDKIAVVQDTEKINKHISEESDLYFIRCIIILSLEMRL